MPKTLRRKTNVGLDKKKGQKKKDCFVYLPLENMRGKPGKKPMMMLFNLVLGKRLKNLVFQMLNQSLVQFNHDFIFLVQKKSNKLHISSFLDKIESFFDLKTMSVDRPSDVSFE